MGARRRAATRGRGQPAAAPVAEAGAEAEPPAAVRDKRLRSSSSRTLRLLLALLALPFCAPQTCPNRCSGHGRCLGGAQLLCSCDEGFAGADCSQRLCASAGAWAAHARLSDDVHAQRAECAAAGVCDRAAGKCVCAPGFEGDACERLACGGGGATPCSGHGRCITMRQAAAGYDGFRLVHAPSAYDEWDADRVRGCLCDWGFFGASCTLRQCPLGDDPTTPGVPEVQELRCRCAAVGGCAAGGSWTVTFAGRTARVRANAVASRAEESVDRARGSGAAPGESLQSVLESLRPGVRTFASVGYSAAAAAPGGGAATGACDALGRNAIRVTFVRAVGDAPPLQVAPGSLVDAAGEPAQLSAVTLQRGTTESLPCSNGGVCSSADGSCACFPGRFASNADGGPGEVPDCGSLLPPDGSAPDPALACPSRTCNQRGTCAQVQRSRAQVAFVADGANNAVRRVDPLGTVTPFAGSQFGLAGELDGAGTSATFRDPFGLALDADGNLLVAERAGARVRLVTPAGAVSTLAGTGDSWGADGPGAAASFAAPQGLAADLSASRGRRVYVADTGMHAIRALVPVSNASVAGGVHVITVAGGGRNATPATGFLGRADDRYGSRCAPPFEDSRCYNKTLWRSFSAARVAGGWTQQWRVTNNPGDGATLANLTLAVEVRNVTALSDGGSPLVNAAEGLPRAVLPYLRNGGGNGQEAALLFRLVCEAAVPNARPGVATVCDFASDDPAVHGPFNLRWLTPAEKAALALPRLGAAPSPAPAFGEVDRAALNAQWEPVGNATLDPAGAAVIAALAAVHALEMAPYALAAGAAQAPDDAPGAPGFAAGDADGQGLAAQFFGPAGVAVDQASGLVYVADSGNHLIRVLDPASGIVTTLAGSRARPPGSVDGVGSGASFRSPSAVAVAKDFTAPGSRTVLLVTEASGTLRKVDVLSGAVTTVAGSAGSYGGADGEQHALILKAADASLQSRALALPTFSQDLRGVAVDAVGGFALVADAGNNALRRVSPAGVVKTVAGGLSASAQAAAAADAAAAGTPLNADSFAFSSAGRNDGVGTSARFNGPAGVVVATLVGPALARCNCFEGSGGPTCLERSCPTGRAWFDEPVDATSAHAVVACSGAGDCNTGSGECSCLPGFAGAACDRLLCPSEDATVQCSGHGRCLSLRELAEVGSFGGAPLGALEVQQVTCSLTQGLFAARAAHSETAFLPWNASLAALQQALESLPSVGFLALRSNPPGAAAVCDEGEGVRLAITFLTARGAVDLLTFETAEVADPTQTIGATRLVQGSRTSYGANPLSPVTWDADMICACAPLWSARLRHTPACCLPHCRPRRRRRRRSSSRCRRLSPCAPSCRKAV
jgi:DNA-binding beta-propeller fold protein YncE